MRLLHGRDPVGVLVGGADVRVVPAGGVQVVVVGRRAGLAQPLRLAVGEYPEACADLDVRVLGLETGDGRAHAVDVAVGRPPAAGDQAYPLGPGRDPCGGAGGNVVGLEPGVLEHVGGGADPLRAVRAVLWAQPALDVDQVVELDPAAKVLTADPEGGGYHIKQVIAVGENGEGLLASRELPAKSLVSKRVKPGHEHQSYQPGR